MITKIKKVTFYSFEVDGKTYRLYFEPVKDLPGYSHRVSIIDDTTNTRIKKDWLGDEFKPSLKNATYYMEKHFNPDFK